MGSSYHRVNSFLIHSFPSFGCLLTCLGHIRWLLLLLFLFHFFFWFLGFLFFLILLFSSRRRGAFFLLSRRLTSWSSTYFSYHSLWLFTSSNCCLLLYLGWHHFSGCINLSNFIAFSGLGGGLRGYLFHGVVNYKIMIIDFIKTPYY